MFLIEYRTAEKYLAKKSRGTSNTRQLILKKGPSNTEQPNCFIVSGSKSISGSLQPPVFSVPSPFRHLLPPLGASRKGSDFSNKFLFAHAYSQEPVLVAFNVQQQNDWKQKTTNTSCVIQDMCSCCKLC